jgi:hypothetical protein
MKSCILKIEGIDKNIKISSKCANNFKKKCINNLKKSFFVSIIKNEIIVKKKIFLVRTIGYQMFGDIHTQITN